MPYRDKLVVWAGHNLLLDGHTRLVLCGQLHIQFETDQLALPDRQACLDWISSHQRNRRNLSKNGIAYSRGKHYLAERLASGRPGRKGGQSDHILLIEKGGENDQLAVEWDAGGVETAERLGRFYGCGERTIRRDKNFAEGVDLLTESCGDVVRQLVLPVGAPLQRRDVGQLLKREAEERCRLLALVAERGRRSLPWFEREKGSFSVPRNPGRVAQIIVDRLGKVDALLVRDGLTRLTGGRESEQ